MSVESPRYIPEGAGSAEELELGSRVVQAMNTELGLHYRHMAVSGPEAGEAVAHTQSRE